MAPSYFTQKRWQDGASLLEVLIAIVILAFGLLSLAALHLSSVRYQKTAQGRSAATFLVSDLADRMRANAAAFNATNTGYLWQEPYAAALGTVQAAVNNNTEPGCSNVLRCSSDEMIARDWWAWRRLLNSTLPQAAAFVSVNASEPRAREVTVMWWEQAAVTNNVNDPDLANISASCGTAGVAVPAIDPAQGGAVRCFTTTVRY